MKQMTTTNSDIVGDKYIKGNLANTDQRKHLA